MFGRAAVLKITRCSRMKTAYTVLVENGIDHLGDMGVEERVFIKMEEHILKKWTGLN
jgi:hypothetical protein